MTTNYQLRADGELWIDSDGQDTWPEADAASLAELLERQGYDVQMECEAHEDSASMRVHVIYNPNRKGAEVRVHKAGCRDIARDVRGSTSNYATAGTSQKGIAEDFYADFIDEGSMEASQAMEYTEFLPCTAGLAETASCPRCGCSA